MVEMLGLTLRHPWAFAVAHLEKRVENRTWKPPAHIIGKRIAIHGGAVPKGEALAACQADAQHIIKEIWDMDYMRSLSKITTNWLKADKERRFPSNWITPGIVATAVVAKVVTESDSPWFGGPYGWVLEDVVTLPEPVPHRGAQSLWPVSAEALGQLARYG